MSATTAQQAPEAAKRQKRAPQPKLTLSGDPSVNLLPPSVRDRAVVRSRIRTGVLLIVLGALVAGGLFAFATYRATEAQNALNAANNRTNELLIEQGKYAEATQINALIGQIEELQSGATAAEVNWSSLYAQLASRVPEGGSIGALSFEGVQPWERIATAEGDETASIIATVDILLGTVTVPDATAFVRSLATLDGHLSSSISTVAVGTDGIVISSITLTLTWDAESGRFVTELPDEDAADDADAQTDADSTDETEG